MHNHSTYSNRTFFIKKDSTLPELKLPVNDRIREKYDITADMLENCAVTFSMIEKHSGLYRIANVEAKLVVNNDRPLFPDEVTYTLVYKFKRHDTRKAGRFLGEFKIDFLGENCGKITLPIDTQIPIVISDSITKTDVV